MTGAPEQLAEPAAAEPLTAVVPAAGSGWPLLELVRPRQWIKNAFVLAPLIFAGAFSRPEACLQALGAVVLFCLAASAVYVLNDLLDEASDRAHPVKRQARPIAAGRVTRGRAVALLACLYLALLTGAAFMPAAGALIVGYVLLNMAYSVRLKHVPVVDLFCVALGFVLRVAAGAEAIVVPLSSWMSITTLCLALYLASLKRRQELLASGAAGRAMLERYTPELLERYAQMSAMGAIIFYGLFTITVRPALAGTVALVLFGLFRYWWLVESRGAGESPTDVVWTDPPLVLTVAAWAGACMWLLAA